MNFHAYSDETWADAYVVSSDEFAAKWNALAEDAMMAGAKLDPTVVRVDRSAGTLRYAVDDRVLMDGAVDADGFVTALELDVRETDPYKRLTYWALAIAVTSADVSPNEVDSCFEELGIEANGNIAGAVGNRIERNGAVYEVSGENGNAVFRYRKEREGAT